MKKIFGIALVLAVVAVMAFGSVALADDPDTVVTATWSGSGTFTENVIAGEDAIVSFIASGTNVNGNFTCVDDNNPAPGWGGGNTHVDTITTNFSSQVSGGWSSYTVDRTASYAYGGRDDGQYLYSYIAASPDGSADMDMNSKTNYTYLSNTSSGFNASANSYILQAWLGNDGDPMNLIDNWAGFNATGGGTADIDFWHSSAGYYGVNRIEFGWGMGSYTNCDATFNGAGTFQVQAVGSNQIRTPIANTSGALAPGGWTVPGDGSFGSCTWNTIATFVGTLSVPNFSVDVQ